MYRVKGKRKEKRDRLVRDYAHEHPQLTQREIGKVFGLDRSAVSRILKAGKSG